MLPKENRLTKRTDFSQVYDKGFYFSQDCIAIKFLQTNSQNTRIGFSIGKNYSKLATRRNQARRILREVANKQLSQMKKGVDIIIMTRCALKKTTGKESMRISTMEEILKNIFLKTNLYK